MIMLIHHSLFAVHLGNNNKGTKRASIGAVVPLEAQRVTSTKSDLGLLTSGGSSGSRGGSGSSVRDDSVSTVGSERVLAEAGSIARSAGGLVGAYTVGRLTAGVVCSVAITLALGVLRSTESLVGADTVGGLAADVVSANTVGTLSTSGSRRTGGPRKRGTDRNRGASGSGKRSADRDRVARSLVDGRAESHSDNAGDSHSDWRRAASRDG